LKEEEERKEGKGRERKGKEGKGRERRREVYGELCSGEEEVRTGTVLP
jgi:hypothetical protein